MKLPAALILLTQAVNTAGYGAGNCKNPTQWDAIVVGAGLSGSIVAAKLSENEPDKCILVVEGGKESGQIKNASEASIPTSKGRFFEDHWNIVAENETPFNSPATYDYLVDYSRNAEYIWGGEDGSGTPGRLIVGKVVGGSGAINGAMMQYPPESQWDAYPDGWKAWDMKNYLDEIHNVMNATVSHGNCINSFLFPENIKW
jgi:choline dehydrogenase-like flavoprotein